MDQADHHGERPDGVHRMFKNPAAGEKGRLFVIFDLERGGGRAGLCYRVHIVMPLVDAIIGELPIRGPCVVRGIDVCRQPLIKAMQLVRPDKMHLARQRSVIAHLAQVVGKGRDAGRKFGGIVIGADPADLLPGHKGRARRRAKRRVAIGPVKPHSLRGEGIHMGRLHQRVSIGAGEMGGQLVGHDKNDIGRLGHRVRSCQL